MTGAPKIAAVDQIAALEPVGRGAAMGALGRVWGNGDLELLLTIRTFAIADGRIHLWVGGGVVWDSDPVAEVEESLTKARPLLEAIGAPLPVGVALVTLLALAVSGRGLVDPAEPVLRADDEALLRGRAAFETLRVYGGRPFRLARISSGWPARRRRSACPPLTFRRLQELAELALGTAGAPDAVLRLVWTPGPADGRPRDSRSSRRSRTSSSRCAGAGLRVVTLLGVRAEASWLLPGVKSTSYAVNMAAEAEAKRRGADDAVFVDAGGRRARGAGHERVVAARRNALHAVARPGHPRGRHAWAP